MEKLSKISIITVVYNGVENIERTIKNVLSQTYKNIEYIIVDGGSNDGTIDIIRKYEQNIKWISEPDEGLYDAMNKGASLATGEWILYRNCGDYFINHQVLEKVMDSYHSNNEDFICCDIRFFNNYGYFDDKPPILSTHYYDRIPFWHPSTLIKRETQINYPYRFKQYKLSSDYDFFIHALQNGCRYIYIPIILSLFEASEGTSSVNRPLALLENYHILKSTNAPKSAQLRILFLYYKIILKKKLAIGSIYPLINKNENNSKFIKKEKWEILSDI